MFQPTLFEWVFFIAFKITVLVKEPDCPMHFTSNRSKSKTLIMIKILAICTSFIIYSCPLFAYSQDNGSTLDSLIHHGITLTIRQHYDEAAECFSEISAKYPRSPAGPFFLAANIQSKMIDFETDEWEKTFDNYFESATARAENLLKNNPSDTSAHFYYGAAYAYKALYLARKKKYLSSLKSSSICLRHLQTTLDLDSTYYDAFLGMGSYYYWRSRMTQFINWLPMIKDRREEGIEMISLALRNGKFTKWVAVNNLSYILIDTGRLDEAWRIAEEGYSAFPKSRFFLWPMAEIHFRTSNFIEAIELYGSILASLDTEPIYNHYNHLVCYLKIASAYYKLNRFEHAIEYCNKILALPENKIKGHKVKSKISEAKEILHNSKYKIPDKKE